MSRWNPMRGRCWRCGCKHDPYERPLAQRHFGTQWCVICSGQLRGALFRHRYLILSRKKLAHMLAEAAAQRAEKPEMAGELEEEIQNGGSS